MRRFIQTVCSTGLAILFVMLLFVSFERPAYAYVDPGSSLLIYQSVTAMVAGAVFYLRGRIKALFHRSSRSTEIPREPAN